MQQVQKLKERQKPQKRYYTIAEWEKLPDYPPYELIDGEIYMMAPPTWEHQRISFELSLQFGNYLRGKHCVATHGAGVWFSRKIRRSSVLVPDLVVMCDHNKIKPQGVVGAPDLVVEILSPSNGNIDKVKKLDCYKREGVREYWIVDPTHKVVDVFQWEKDLPMQTYVREDKIKVGVLDDCEIDLSLVFPAPEPIEWPTVES